MDRFNYMKIAIVIGKRLQLVQNAIISHNLRFNNIEHCIIHSRRNYDENISRNFVKKFNLSNLKYILSWIKLNECKMIVKAVIKCKFGDEKCQKITSETFL